MTLSIILASCFVSIAVWIWKVRGDFSKANGRGGVSDVQIRAVECYAVIAVQWTTRSTSHAEAVAHCTSLLRARSLKPKLLPHRRHIVLIRRDSATRWKSGDTSFVNLREVLAARQKGDRETVRARLFFDAGAL